MSPDQLTIEYAQKHQPWTVPYTKEILLASENDVPHILATHNCLHAAKTVGKIAAIFERLDHHSDETVDPTVMADMAADLVTEALRFANLYKFDLASALVRRIQEKNGINILELPKET